MSGSRKKFSRDFKIKVVEAYQSGVSAVELSRQFEIHANLIYTWTREYQKDPANAFQSDKNEDGSPKLPALRHRPEERLGRGLSARDAGLNARREQRDAALQIEPDDFGIRFCMQVRQHAGALVAVIDAIRHAELQVEHAHFQHVARFSALDVDRAREHVRAGILWMVRLMVNLERIGQHLVCRYAAGGKELERVHAVVDALVRHRVDRHRLA